MARTFIFIMTAVALTALLFASGITSDSGSFSSTIINSLLSGQDVTTTDLWVKIILAIVIITGGATVASVFGNSGASIAIANGALVLFLVNFVTDYVHVMVKAKEACGSTGALCGDWVYWVISLIFIPIIVGFLFTMYEWVTGGD